MRYNIAGPAGSAEEPDAAVGAFVRLIRDAPPLHASENARGSPSGSPSDSLLNKTCRTDSDCAL